MSRAYGIDVSHWQSSTPDLLGLDFLFARATIGTQRDEMYAKHIANARKAGLLVGAYHFGDIGTSPAAQVAAFLKTAGDVDFYVLDHEGNRRMTAATAKAFVNGIQATGRKCGVYASLSGFPDFGQDYNWIALWGSDTPPSLPWKFWQYGGSPIDRDVFNGSVADLRAFAGHPPTQEEPEVAGLRFRIIGQTQGVATIKGSGHALVRVFDQGRVAVPDGEQRQVDATVELLAALDANPGDRIHGYLVGARVGETSNEAAFVLASDVTFVPAADTTPFAQADLDAAIAADRLKAKPILTVAYE